MEDIIKYKDAQIQALQKEVQTLKDTNGQILTIKNNAISKLKNLLFMLENPTTELDNYLQTR